ncbi:MAG: hypothetical protein ACREOL_10075 [Candidatus Dormibacteria bacterium]
MAGPGQRCQQLAFHLGGLHLDTGNEFSNVDLVNYCREREIAFNRSTSYPKNGSRHGERGNWTAVRRQIGFDGLEG